MKTTKQTAIEFANYLKTNCVKVMSGRYLVGQSNFSIPIELVYDDWIGEQEQTEPKPTRRTIWQIMEDRGVGECGYITEGEVVEVAQLFADQEHSEEIKVAFGNGHLQGGMDQNKEWQEKYDIAIKALTHIAYPIDHLREEAEKEGGKLNGMMALQYANNGSILTMVAKDALIEIASLNQP